jgi:hypothetical protein
LSGLLFISHLTLAGTSISISNMSLSLLTAPGGMPSDVRALFDLVCSLLESDDHVTTTIDTITGSLPVLELTHLWALFSARGGSVFVQALQRRFGDLRTFLLSFPDFFQIHHRSMGPQPDTCISCRAFECAPQRRQLHCY